MTELNQFSPHIREYQEGDKADDPKVAIQLSALIKKEGPCWVLIVPYPEPRVMACHYKRRQLLTAPKAVANKSLTFNQWVKAVEAASIKEAKKNGR